MKKLLITLGCLSIHFCVVTYAQSWVKLGDDLRASGPSTYVSLALDRNGTPYVAFPDGGYGGKVSVVKFDGKTWNNVGTPGFSQSFAHYTSLAIDLNSKLYLAYADQYDGNKATVKTYDGHTWITLGQKLSANARHISLAIDRNGTPYLAYMYWVTDTCTVVVSKYNGTSWEPVGNVGISAGGILSLAIDGNSTPYVSYEDYLTGKRGWVKKYDGGSWVPVGNGDVFGPLAIDDSGAPYVAYADGYYGQKATVMKYDGSNWVPVGDRGFSVGKAEEIALVIDGRGTPYLAYADNRNNSFIKTTVMKYTGNSWVTLGNAGISEHNASSTCLAVDSCSTPYVAYFNWDNLSYDNSVTVQKPDLGFLFSLRPNPTTGTFEVSVPDAGTMTIYAMDGREVLKFDVKSGTTEVTLPERISSGVYICHYYSKSGAHISIKEAVIR